MMTDDHKQRMLSGAAFFKNLANPIRLCILNQLLEREEMCVSDFVACMGESQPLISKHLIYLKNEGILCSRAEGQFVYYRLSDPLTASILRLVNGRRAEESA